MSLQEGSQQTAAAHSFDCRPDREEANQTVVKFNSPLALMWPTFFFYIEHTCWWTVKLEMERPVPCYCHCGYAIILGFYFCLHRHHLNIIHLASTVDPYRAGNILNIFMQT